MKISFRTYCNHPIHSYQVLDLFNDIYSEQIYFQKYYNCLLITMKTITKVPTKTIATYTVSTLLIRSSEMEIEKAITRYIYHCFK